MKRRQKTLDAWVVEKRRMGNTDSDSESGQMCTENASTSDLCDSEPTYEDCMGEGAETSTSSDCVSVIGTQLYPVLKTKGHINPPFILFCK